MSKTIAFLFGVVSYLIFFLTFLYAIGFVGNLVVPKSIDSGLDGSLLTALLIDLGLLTLFALQHSVMARPGFKKWWTQFVPESIERSVFVLFASLALLLVFWQWRPMAGVVWSIDNAVGRFILQVLFFAGWLIVLLSTFMINHFDLFGLRQVYLNQRGHEYTDLGFRTPAFYKLVRHPIMVGFIIAFWAASTMTVGHLVFAAVTTAYILVAVQLEERDLASFYGEKYASYRSRVGMFIPLPKKRA
jgi:protein-S-isoprenylcysteine O-methyltransferase Ste14